MCSLCVHCVPLHESEKRDVTLELSLLAIVSQRQLINTICGGLCVKATPCGAGSGHLTGFLCWSSDSETFEP